MTDGNLVVDDSGVTKGAVIISETDSVNMSQQEMLDLAKEHISASTGSCEVCS